MKFAYLEAFCVIAALSSGDSLAAEQGSSIRNWWPFGKKPAPASKSMSQRPLAKPASTPKLTGKPVGPNSWPSRAKPGPPKPSPIERMTSGTKKMWNNTREFFTPGDASGTKRSAPPPKQAQEPSTWERWFGQREAKRGPRTTNEFLAQPRLEP
jgi:hypothetical protein